MRLYHFINEEYGREALRKKRLKIARIGELNDPFEFAALDRSNDELRQMLESIIEGRDKKFGLLCFSKIWNNPVQWAHYSDKHKGLCLGFDVRDELPMKMNYSKKRISSDELVVLFEEALNEFETKTEMGKDKTEYDAIMESILQPLKKKLEDLVDSNMNTKFFDWQYEKERRMFVPLKEKIDDLYYYDFSDNSELKLKEVIIGARSNLTRVEIEGNLEITDESEIPDIFKVRMSYSEFFMVKDETNTLLSR